ncbi:MAG: patatin-like phospholipase family protein [Microthrixaceae bacterium]
MTTAFVLSGGGSLGAVQVGMLAALEERGLRPDLLVGTSVGALNAAYLGAHGFDAGTVERLAGLWRRIRRSDVFPIDPLRQALALAGRRSSLCSPGPLQRLIAANLPLGDLHDARIPLYVVATDVMSGEEVLLSTGNACSAVLASAAIPAIFPSVEREGRVLMDGGVANNTAVSHALALGADRVVVLPAGFACALAEPPATPLAAAMHALTLLIEQRLLVEIAQIADRAEIIVLPPLCPLSVSAIDFGMSSELMARAHHASGDWLDTGRHHLPHPERFLSLHSHSWAHEHPHHNGPTPTVREHR